MRRALLLILAVGLCGCRENAREKVTEAAREYDPKALDLHEGFNDYVRCSREVPELEIGVITLGDRDEVRYWFASHHATRDQGCTRFEYSDGSERFLDGAFCCEVQLAEVQPANRTQLDAFLDSREGVRPGPGG